MPTWVDSIDGVSIAVGVGSLVQVGVPADKPPHLRVVEPAPHQRQPRVPLRPVAARRPELVGARAAPRACHSLPERRGRQAGRHRLACVRDGLFPAQSISFLLFINAGVTSRVADV